MSDHIRHSVGWTIVVLAMGLANVADWLCRAGAWLMDREDVYREFDKGGPA